MADYGLVVINSADPEYKNSIKVTGQAWECIVFAKVVGFARFDVVLVCTNISK